MRKKQEQDLVWTVKNCSIFAKVNGSLKGNRLLLTNKKTWQLSKNINFTEIDNENEL